MFRLQFNYSHVGDLTRGFSENFWVNSDLYATAKQRADLLAPLLIAMHGSQTVLTDCRIVDPDFTKAGAPVRYGTLPRPASSDATDSDYPSTALYIELANEDGTTTHQWLKGLPDGQTLKGKMALNGDFITAFKAFAGALTKTGSLFCMRVQNPAANSFSISNITDAGTVTATGHGFQTGNKVIITGRGTKTKPFLAYWRKTWEVLRMDDNTFKLVGADVQTGYVFSGKAKAKFETPLAKSIATVSPVRATSHKIRKAKN